MKKILLTLGICFILVAMPAMTANSMIRTNNPRIKTLISDVEKQIPIIDNPPGWANGVFSGDWGLDIWGQWHIPIGWTHGYYNRAPNFGYFNAVFAKYGEENATWLIKGFFFGPFMFGSFAENEYALGLGINHLKLLLIDLSFDIAYSYEKLSNTVKISSNIRF